MNESPKPPLVRLAAVELSVREGDQAISPVASDFTLEGLLARITDENLHREVDAGPAVGNEVW
jgi:antitoxin component of MazEF toxin-antitoxin module